MEMKLKQAPAHIRPFAGRSDILEATSVPIGSNPRAWYLSHPTVTPPPVISSSAFIPTALVTHLMRNKKPSALGVKFQSGRSPPDAITNMEGALHSFVTPIVKAWMHGDYVYQRGHGVVRFPPADGEGGGMQQARVVLVSAQIQLDFEGSHVLLKLTALEKDEMVGEALPTDFVIPDAGVKQMDKQRADYDQTLKRHAVYHLMKDGRLPALRRSTDRGNIGSSTVEMLERYIMDPSMTQEVNPFFEQFVPLSRTDKLSLELLFNCAVQQLHNELSALEALCPQGYVYTSDPPSIFARKIGAQILNRLQFAALSHLASNNSFANMRAFAFNDYDDSGAVKLLKAALKTQKHVWVGSKQELFTGPGGIYAPLAGMEGALLVIHNNSDGFGQNIETEWQSGSMDGAIGVNSSAAASLKQNRDDLVLNLM